MKKILPGMLVTNILHEAWKNTDLRDSETNGQFDISQPMLVISVCYFDKDGKQTMVPQRSHQQPWVYAIQGQVMGWTCIHNEAQVIFRPDAGVQK